jgi:hypothetical protein
MKSLSLRALPSVGKPLLDSPIGSGFEGAGGGLGDVDRGQAPAAKSPSRKHAMSTSSITRWASVTSITASVLIVLSQALRLGIGLTIESEPSALHTSSYALALLGMCALLLALTALYAHGSSRAGRLGLAGYLLAFVGTTLVAGDWWFEAFIVPTIATKAPDVLTQAPSGSLLTGAIATVGFYTAGWLLFGLATFRADTAPRPVAALVIVGGLLGPLALTTPYQIPLAVGVGWIGYSLPPPHRGQRIVPAHDGPTQADTSS